MENQYENQQDIALTSGQHENELKYDEGELYETTSSKTKQLNVNTGESNEENNELKSKRQICIALLIIFSINLSWIIFESIAAQGTTDQVTQIHRLKDFISSQKNILTNQQNDYYWFSVSTKQLILTSNLYELYKRDRKPYQMSRDVHLRAILLTQLVHNVNFKGEVQVELSPYDDTLERKELVIRNLMQLEKNYYERNYHIDKYQNYQLPFCLIVPSYNNIHSRLYRRNLDSIFMQDYKNYRIIYIDDHSPENTGKFVQQYLNQKAIPSEKIKIIVNSFSKKALQNIYEGVHEHCRQGEIVALIDGDDSLIGRQVLKLYNAIFHQQKSVMVYSNFLKINSNSRTEVGFGDEVPAQYFQPGYSLPRPSLYASHFMAFYVDIFNKIQKKDFCYDNGTFFDFAYDKAILTPIIQMAPQRIFYVKEMVYEYRNDTGINDGGGDWRRVSDFIDTRMKYEPLTQFGFIDKALRSVSEGQPSQFR